MTVEEREARAIENKKTMNCAQAVALAFSDVVDVDEKTLLKLASGFGLGMGTAEGTCGTLSGAVMVAGLCAEKGQALSLAKEMTARFKSLCGGALACRDIKGIETGKTLCSCLDCVRYGARAAAEVLDTRR